MTQENRRGGVGIVVDSVADLPPDYVKEYDFKIVPFHVYFDKEGKSYDEGVTLSYHEFYNKLENPDLGMPKTQGPNQGEYLQAYEEMLKRYDCLLSLHMSSKMSVAYNSATLARQMLPEADITLFDSQSVSMVLGLYAIQAARAAREGVSPAEILKKLERYKSETVQLFMASTLKYLRQSGRVNQMAYLLGTALKIKPLLEFRNGMGEPAGRELSEERAYVKIAKTMAEKFGERPVIATVVHSLAPEKAEQLKSRISQRVNVKELIEAEIGSTLGAHGGPGLVGSAAFPID
jgi:DegV family protein with EDD domain